MIEAYFNKIENQICHNISAAKSRIFIAVAWFTNQVLFDVLINALNRNVCVKLLLIGDSINKNEYGLDFSQFIEAGGELYFSDVIKVHHKFCIIDNMVITGSYNWTYYAEIYNAENIILSDDFALVQCYENEFERLQNITRRCTKYEPINLDAINGSELYDNYSYLCNDLLLKGEQYRDIVTKINKKRNIDFQFEQRQSEECDNRGIPILKKRRSDVYTIRRLVNMSVERVPIGRPNAGRQFVHAYYISNNIWEEDKWVDIFDTEYVDELSHYFYKKDGGTLNDDMPLPSIPEELYNPKMKYHFKHICYSFYKFGKYGDARKKVGGKGQILQKNDSPYLFNKFHTLIRYDKNPNEYIGFNSMTELCHLIVKSLFVPNVPDDNDIITDYSCLDGIYKASIDDFVSICKEIEGGICSEKEKSLIKTKLQVNPDGIWLQKRMGQSMACAYGFYTNTTVYRKNLIPDKNGHWYVLIRLKSSSINYESDKFREILDGIITRLKLEHKKGIINICPIQSVGYFEKYGFKREYNSEVSKSSCVMRLVFETSNSLL